MKHFFLVGILIILAFYSLAFADEPVEISGTITLEQSPFIVETDLVVPENESLTIEPGVEILFQGNYRLVVEGTLSAIGTEADSIRVKGNITESSRELFRLVNEDERSFFKHVVITEAYTAISAVYSGFDYDNGRIGNISFTAITNLGILNPVEINVRNTKFHDIQRTGILITENSNFTIDGNIFTKCGLGTSWVGAVHLSNQTAGGENNPVITNNHFYKNEKYAIIAWDITNNSSINPTIKDNIFEYNYGGMNLRQTSGIIRDNIFRDNYDDTDDESGQAIMIAGISSSPLIYRNTFTGNYQAFVIMENANPIIGHPDHAQSGENKFINNIDFYGNNTSIFLFPNQTADIDAIGNYWGTTDRDEIIASIMDKRVNEALGLVIFEPFLIENDESDEVVPISREMISISSYPNPISLSSGQDLNFNVKLNTEEEIRIELYNIRGQRIATVFTGTPASKEFSLNMSSNNLRNLNLSSGIYFYRLNTENQSSTKKMLILK